VIPLMIWGSDRAWPHGRAWPGPGRVRVRVGRPIAPPAATGRESVRELGETIERAFSELARGDGET
jgi:1-acyl-sn-glycerol-3-phosphate acyltransferase